MGDKAEPPQEEHELAMGLAVMAIVALILVMGGIELLEWLGRAH